MGRPGGGATATPTPTVTGTLTLRVLIYIDTNRDKMMGEGEGADDVLVIAVTADRRWSGRAFTRSGEATIPLPVLPAGTEIQVQVPYLHRSGTFKVPREGGILAEIRLPQPELPVYLP
jgi:hypothetical protein